MNHLSGIDAAFLHLESPEMPMHVGSLNVLELPPVGLNEAPEPPKVGSEDEDEDGGPRDGTPDREA